MTVTRDQFREGYTWDEWLDEVEEDRDKWQARYRDATLGELRAEYQNAPTPRYAMCIVEDGCADSAGSVPYIAKACEQSGAPGGVELRLFSRSQSPELMKQYLTEGEQQTPICAVFDQDWVQISVWGPRPEPLVRKADEWRDSLPQEEFERLLDDWYTHDQGRTVLTEFLRALDGQGIPSWKSGREQGIHLHKQAERARERS